MKNILLYFSAFVPMYCLIVIKFILGFISNSISPDSLTIISFITYLLFTLFGIAGLVWNVWGQKERAVEITILKSNNITDQHFLGYFSLFVLFALPFELAKLGMFVVSLLIIAFIGVVYVNNEMYYINPLLNVLGYNFYDITFLTKGSDQEKRAKMFYKEKLDLTQKQIYHAKIKNTNFSFLEKKA